MTVMHRNIADLCGIDENTLLWSEIWSGKVLVQGTWIPVEFLWQTSFLSVWTQGTGRALPCPSPIPSLVYRIRLPGYHYPVPVPSLPWCTESGYWDTITLSQSHPFPRLPFHSPASSLVYRMMLPVTDSPLCVQDSGCKLIGVCM